MSDWTDTQQAYDYGHTLLEGERVRLRRTREEDLPVLAAWWTAPEWGALQMGAVRPRPDADIVEQVREWSSNTSAGGAGFSVELVSSQQLIGHVTLWGGGLPARAAEYAIMIGPDFVSQGYGVEATRLMVGYGFRELGLHRVELHVWAYNTRARKAYERAGFTVEGVRRAVVFHDGTFHDEVIMGVLAEEWIA